MAFRKPDQGAFGYEPSNDSRWRARKHQHRATGAGRRDAGPGDDDSAPSAAGRQPGGELPIFKHKRQLQYLVETHPVVIVVGETGCGKTTQVPLFLAEAGWAEAPYRIVCTQPRRVAAMSVAARVAEQRGCEVGDFVGYAVRFEEAAHEERTRIKYVTDGVLLREMMDDPLLTKYSVVMVDEAHERSTATDLLLGLLKKVQKRRPDLRLLISSATLEAQLLFDFFDASTDRSGAPRHAAGADLRGLPRSTKPAMISIEGRGHPVQVHYLQEPAGDYVKAAVQTAVDIHREDVPGDILVFLTGQEEVERAVAMLREEASRLGRSGPLHMTLHPVPLYAGLPGGMQRAALELAARGARKVVVATNVAETSLTIEGVVHVVDSCFLKQRCYNPLLGLESLVTAPASKANAAQRAGRAGRVRLGHCFRLCTEEDFLKLLPEAGIPELQRTDLSGVVLQLKALGLDSIMAFPWLSPPPAECMVRALETLHALGAIDQDARLTPDVGIPLSALPLPPQLGRALLASAELGCSEEMATAAAILTAGHVWAPSGGQPRALDAAKARFAVAEGDLATMLNIYRAWELNSCSAKWCHRNFLVPSALRRAEEIRRQLLRLLQRLGAPPPASCGDDLEPLCKAASAGFFASAACYEATEYDRLGPEDQAGVHMYRLVRHRGAVPGEATVKLRMHPSSVLHRVRPKWVVFASAQQGDSGWYEMQGVTAIQPDWLVEACPQMFHKVS